ncbi:MAG TPA: MBL fold metallo-hydrolase, partial [Bacteroidales bacterium]|nr:MBL fold metallo-hydrolase [Bacteroidales bacterium]
RDNRRRSRMGQSLIAPLYTAAEVEAVIKYLTPIAYDSPFRVAPGITVRVVEAGHILGSASLEVTVEETGHSKTVIFSGDLGPAGMAILKDPEVLRKADLVFLESTYGDRDHRSLQETLDQGEEIINQAVKTKGKILIPAFAVGRTQQLLYYMAKAIHMGNVSHLPVYLDSPMAIEATKIYMKHLELFDEEADEMAKSGELKLDMSHLHMSVTADESRALNYVEGPCMIIAGSGMCNAGRILHHLRHNLWSPNTHVIIAGYQAEGTLGRRLVDGAKDVTIFGEKIVVKAQIHLLGGLSAHAGQSDLVKWFSTLAPSKPRLILAHGEDKGRIPLAALIEKKYSIRAELPGLGDVIKL